jgi:hypothetical protein
VSHVYCPSCGFQNPETSNYCSKCGSLIVVEEPSDPTLTLFLGDIERETAAAPAPAHAGGPALVVRSGGGRTGESFPLERERTSIGRSPECDVFLDDVTVSRHHAQVVTDDRGVRIDDLGSLNGTYVNRQRIDTTQLVDGDEIQIGKYRLIFLSR